ncbi:hypothetical protein [Maridesulfovibrio sp. FT414]|uniref:hypothetical protein n=1 Tax=Maridesulfovibrio sp. FT414 TaxID=2979469 RepID=UPI003D803C11
MKKLIRAVLMSAVMVVLMCGGVFAESSFVQQGGMIVPGITYVKAGTYIVHSSIFLTNVTNEVVRCNVTFYDQDGNDINNLAKVYTGSASSAPLLLATGSGEWDIPAHSTRIFQLDSLPSDAWKFGHADIRWSSMDPKPHKALVGALWLTGASSTGNFSSSAFINNGQPF